MSLNVPTLRRAPRTRVCAMPLLTLSVLLALPGCNSQEQARIDRSLAERDVRDVTALPTAAPAASPAAPSRPAEPAISEAEFGLPFYPNAKPLANQPTADSLFGTDGMAALVLESPDAMDKVAAFYSDRMAGAERSQTTENGKNIVRFSQASRETGNGVRSVQISKAAGRTRIELLNVKATQSADSLFAAPPTNLPVSSLGGNGAGGARGSAPGRETAPPAVGSAPPPITDRAPAGLDGTNGGNGTMRTAAPNAPPPANPLTGGPGDHAPATIKSRPAPPR